MPQKKPQQQHTKRLSVFDEKSQGDLDPVYSNLPQYDVPPHTFNRKQSFPGDLLSTERLLQLERQKQASAETQGDSQPNAHAQNRKESDQYMNMTGSAKLRISQTAIYDTPSKKHKTVVKDDDIYDHPRKQQDDNLYLEMQAISEDTYDTPRQIHQYANQESLSNAVHTSKASRLLKKLSMKAKPTRKSSKKSAAPSKDQYNADIRRMSQKESYPGDIELPPEYTNFKKRSVPFDDQDIYENV